MQSLPRWALIDAEGMERAVAVGMFDGVHLGHQLLVGQLSQCAHERGLSSCIITFASHPLRQICPEKAPKLLTPCGQKAEYLRMAGADEVATLCFTDELRRLTAREFMRKIVEEMDVKVWMMGFNHRFGSDGLRDFNEYARIGRGLGVEVKQAGCEVIGGMDLPVSSSLIRQALAKGDIDVANAMLGRPFAIRGRVEAGRQIGRTIGFPTANIRPDIDEQALPKRGAYACEAIVSGMGRWPAMTNIGCRPTIGQGLAPTIETHAIGFDGDLYGKEVEVRFLARLRGERQFGSLEALAAQLNQDKQQSLEISERTKTNPNHD